MTKAAPHTRLVDRLDMSIKMSWTNFTLADILKHQPSSPQAKAPEEDVDVKHLKLRRGLSAFNDSLLTDAGKASIRELLTFFRYAVAKDIDTVYNKHKKFLADNIPEKFWKSTKDTEAKKVRIEAFAEVAGFIFAASSFYISVIKHMYDSCDLQLPGTEHYTKKLYGQDQDESGAQALSCGFTVLLPDTRTAVVEPVPLLAMFDYIDIAWRHADPNDPVRAQNRIKVLLDTLMPVQVLKYYKAFWVWFPHCDREFYENIDRKTYNLKLVTEKEDAAYRKNTIGVGPAIPSDPAVRDALVEERVCATPWVKDLIKSWKA